jgi:uncharacterized protein involved in outer membrane biogenesis
MSRRTLVIGAAAVLAVAVIVVMMVVSQVDRVVKRAIESYGSAATQTDVRVGAVDIHLSSTTAGLRDLSVANPPGFSSTPALRLGEVNVALDASSIGTDVVVLDEVTIVAPQVSFELDANRTANVDIIRGNVERYEHQTDPAATTPQPGETPAATVPVRVDRRAHKTRILIKKLSITGGRVEIDATALGGKRKVVELPDSELIGIGEESGGATGDELAVILVTTLLSDVATTVAATQVQTKIEEAFGGKAGKALGKGVADAIKGLGGVLNDALGE